MNFRHRLRAGYGDTDQSGIVHHAVYLRWLEDARVAMWRTRGMDFRQLESERVGMAVIHADVRYKLPALFDDALEIETWVGELTRVKLRVDYRVWREDALLLEAGVTLAIIDLGRMRAVRVPETIAQLSPPGSPDSPG